MMIKMIKTANQPQNESGFLTSKKKPCPGIRSVFPEDTATSLNRLAGPSTG